jgi:hypothetical protein
MTEKALFEQKGMLGYGLWVYPDRVELNIGTGRTTIPLNKIASVECSWVAGQVIIETTGGKRFAVVCHGRGKEAKQIIDSLIL